MKAQSLKNAILQLAVQGKLVPQNPHDEPLNELLKKIKTEKAQLIKEKKIKAEKPLAPITDEEKPFDIPDSWEWVRLGEIGETNIGLTYKPSEVSNEGIPVLRSNNIQNGRICYDDLLRVNKSVSEKLMVQVGDVLICARNGSRKLVGKSAIIECNNMTFGAFMAIYRSICNPYIQLFINSMVFRLQLEGANTTTINQVTQDMLKNALCPLPPLAEQQRIVEKIEQLMPLVEQYDSYEKELSALETKFPQDLKKSVLQFAVQGKLVPQDDTDEPASELLKKIKAEKATLIKEKKIKAEKLLTRITDEEKPFDIPDSWEWARLDELCAYIQRGKSPKYSDVRKIPVIAQKCNQWEGFSIEKAKFIDPDSINGYVKERMLQDCDLMWNSTGIGTLGRMAMYETRLNPYGVAVADSHVTVIRPFGGFVLSVYLLKYFSSPFVQNVIEDKSEGSTKQKELSTSTIKNYIVPIPPLAEQQRIVEKVEQLLALCDVLADENKLKQYQLPKRLAKVIKFTPVETAEEHEHLIAARADEISPETRSKEQERLALLRKKR
ncbi:restriction endonuclease subunit S [Oscillibacter sp. GMB15532]|uniref:restriction endonuclease subunit S n=1 Tax=Oscillibacter sp. GMB15532 TaxID=3230022 RepID=UPI0034DDE65B